MTLTLKKHSVYHKVRVKWGALHNFKCVDYFQVEYHQVGTLWHSRTWEMPLFQKDDPENTQIMTPRIDRFRRWESFTLLGVSCFYDRTSESACCDIESNIYQILWHWRGPLHQVRCQSSSLRGLSGWPSSSSLKQKHRSRQVEFSNHLYSGSTGRFQSCFIGGPSQGGFLWKYSSFTFFSAFL